MLDRPFLPQKVFLFLGGVFGIIFLLVTPPFQVPDEYQHFLHAYHFSQGKLKAEVINGSAGGYFPASLRQFDLTLNQAVAANPKNKQKLKDLWIQFKLPLNPEERTFLVFSDTARYASSAYLPQAIGISLGRWLEAPPVVIFYLGRLTNGLIWFFLVWWSLKLTPIFKWVMTVLALTPMSLFQAASVSVDAVTNGIAFLTVSFFLYLSLGPLPRVERKQIVVLSGLVFLLAFTKQIYILLSGLFFMIPAKKFNGWRSQIMAWLPIFLTGLCAFMLWQGLHGELYPPGRADGSITFSPRQQLVFIFEHPADYIKIIVLTVKRELFLWLAMFVGILGWIDTVLPLAVYWTFYPFLLAVALWDNQPQIILSLSVKLVALAVFGFTVIALLTSLYLYWNRLQAPLIQGLQGRYLTPVSLLAVLPFYWSKNPIYAPFLLGRGVFTYLFLILAVTVWALVNRYYIG
jgi:uncharacterized membrane protein